MLGRRGRARPEAQPRFSLKYEGHRHILSLFQGQDALSIAEWAAFRPDAAAALGQAFAAADEGRPAPEGQPLVTTDAQHLYLHPAFVAQLGAADAATLDFPSPTLLALDLRSQGRISDDDFRLEVRWVRPGGQPVRTALTGALVDDGVGIRRIPEPLYSLHSAARQVAQPLQAADRYAALSELRAAWPDDARAPVESDGYLRDLRVHHASQFSLKLGRLGPFDFDPVLFGPKASAGVEHDGRELDEDADNVLAPGAQRLFAEDRFRREAGARPLYVLRDGEYVFIDPALRPALDAVRKLQDAPEAERRAFVLNPRRDLRQRLGEAQSDATDVDRLFVETEQFSARVAGVDIWRAPVLPWIAPAADNGWWPKRFGLRVGQEYYVLPPENVHPLLERVEAGLAEGSQTIAVGALLEAFPPAGPPPPRELPVTEQVREAVEAFRPFADAKSGRVAHVEEPPTTFEALPELGRKLFLIIRENLEEVEFSPLPGTTRHSDDRPAALEAPSRLKTTLKSHQLAGLSWLVRGVSAARPGALLADDMGLGKTLQAIALMAWLQAEAEAGRHPSAPFLVVAPTGLLGTWRDEIVRHLHAPQLGPVLCAFGSDLKMLKEEDAFGARDIESGRASLRAEAWSDAGVVLTTYETLRDYHFSFARTRFGLIVYDEIQKLKNPASQLSRAAKTLNGTFVLGMTGTPVENRLQDLWAISDVLSPGLLGSSRDFERRHPPGDGEALRRLKASLTEGDPPYMLRRLKEEVLGALPAKHSLQERRNMPDRQAKLYRDLVVRAAALATAGTAGPGGMLQTLAALRSASLHPDDPREATADLDAYAQNSARLSRTLEILEDVAAKGEKALLFVEDLAMQDRLASLLQVRFKLPSRPFQINGDVPGAKRQAMVCAFQERAPGFDVMILSPKAGGVGLTLTAANHVVHLSRWWNPAVEDQATDRVHRIGQTREVHVHFPMAVHPDPAIGETSFDLRLDALIARKRALTRDLLLPPESTDSDLAELFREVAEGAPDDDSPTRTVTPGPSSVVADGATSPPRAPLKARVEGLLTLPRMAQAAGALVWRRGPGAPRPTDEIVGIFAGKTISHVCIRDPYALARPHSREAQIAFLTDLAKRVRTIEAVTLEYAPEADGDLSENEQRADLKAAFSRAFPSGGPKLDFCRRSKRRGDDFHDRFVDIEVRGAGGASLRHELSIGRGLEALYDLRKQCTVSYAPPGQ